MDERRIAPRHKAQLKAQIRSFLLFDEVDNTESEEEMVMVGAQTSDISESGLSFMLPAESLDRSFLDTIIGRTLQVVLELPGGTIGIEATAVRYEELPDDTGYLIGAQIAEMDDADRQLYEGFLTDIPA